MGRLDEAFKALKQGFVYDEDGNKLLISGITKDELIVKNTENLFINQDNWCLDRPNKIHIKYGSYDYWVLFGLYKAGHYDFVCEKNGLIRLIYCDT